MSEPAITPQTPGELPSVDTDRIEAIASGGVDDVLQAIDELTDADLVQLDLVERAGKGRKTVLGTIVREQERRAKGADPEPGEGKTPNLGNTTDYANMRGKDIDPSKLTRPVLSLDGWVVPPQPKEF